MLSHGDEAIQQSLVRRGRKNDALLWRFPSLLQPQIFPLHSLTSRVGFLSTLVSDIVPVLRTVLPYNRCSIRTQWVKEGENDEKNTLLDTCYALDTVQDRNGTGEQLQQWTDNQSPSCHEFPEGRMNDNRNKYIHTVLDGDEGCGDWKSSLTWWRGSADRVGIAKEVRKGHSKNIQFKVLILLFFLLFF